MLHPLSEERCDDTDTVAVMSNMAGEMSGIIVVAALLPTAPLPELGRTRQGLVAACAWTRPWDPGPQLQLRPPRTGPRPQRPLLPSHSRPLAASLSRHVPALGAGAGAQPGRHPVFAQQLRVRTHRYMCVMVRAPYFMRRAPGSSHVCGSQHKALCKCRKPPGQLGNLPTLGEAVPPPTPASGPPPSSHSPGPLLPSCLRPVLGRGPLLGTGSPSCLDRGRCLLRSGCP